MMREINYKQRFNEKIIVLLQQIIMMISNKTKISIKI